MLSKKNFRIPNYYWTVGLHSGELLASCQWDRRFISVGKV